MDIGVIGVGVMGENLVMNMLDKGHSVAIYNRTHEKTTKLIGQVSSEKQDMAQGCASLEELVKALRQPRKILLMVKAGRVVDAFIEKLRPLLSKDDLIIDGGNSHFNDTTRRCQESAGHHYFIGCGISGGEEGARHGPSLMPGGDVLAWEGALPLFSSIAAVSTSKTPCCEWIGGEGSGHLVKTVHNGIEYAEMQILADMYQVLRGTRDPASIEQMLSGWRDKGTSGFLLEALQTVFKKAHNGQPIIDQIVDEAQQKGTGAWTAEEGLRAGVPIPTISEAVTSRVISSMKQVRTSLGSLPSGAEASSEGFTEGELMKAFMLCRAISYTQGLNLIKKVSSTNGWGIDLSVLCRVWSNGCIIRSEFLDVLSRMTASEVLESSVDFVLIATDGIAPLRKVVSHAISTGVAVPCLSTSLSYYDALRTEEGPGNLIQALRDFFGAHTLLLKGETEPVHIDWSMAVQ
ncbi:6-phosphogluconate dehydrogenase [Nematocida displodere]|uniref:6-phosphogluconate dehydrogenase, decarboxylating n=1 Tax=Nematocida displodere TaxID=1805483 RepID=A0A177ECP0_9MICR|nr:6-phosphogluconate dehydrogenase [Nematocida displodere]